MNPLPFPFLLRKLSLQKLQLHRLLPLLLIHSLLSLLPRHPAYLLPEQLRPKALRYPQHPTLSQPENLRCFHLRKPAPLMPPRFPPQRQPLQIPLLRSHYLPRLQSQIPGSEAPPQPLPAGRVRLPLLRQGSLPVFSSLCFPPVRIAFEIRFLLCTYNNYRILNISYVLKSSGLCCFIGSSVEIWNISR